MSNNEKLADIQSDAAKPVWSTPAVEVSLMAETENTGPGPTPDSTLGTFLAS